MIRNLASTAHLLSQRHCSLERLRASYPIVVDVLAASRSKTSSSAGEVVRPNKYVLQQESP